jgi:hypothetical protein
MSYLVGPICAQRVKRMGACANMSCSFFLICCLTACEQIGLERGGSFVVVRCHVAMKHGCVGEK